MSIRTSLRILFVSFIMGIILCYAYNHLLSPKHVEGEGLRAHPGDLVSEIPNLPRIQFSAPHPVQPSRRKEDAAPDPSIFVALPSSIPEVTIPYSALSHVDGDKAPYISSGSIPVIFHSHNNLYRNGLAGVRYSLKLTKDGNHVLLFYSLAYDVVIENDVIDKAGKGYSLNTQFVKGFVSGPDDNDVNTWNAILATETGTPLLSVSVVADAGKKVNADNNAVTTQEQGAEKSSDHAPVVSSPHDVPVIPFQPVP